MFYVKAEDCFEDNNHGLIYGIHYVINPHKDNEEVMACTWFKTEEERHAQAVKDNKENDCLFAECEQF